MFKQFSASLLVTLSALLGQSALAQDYPQGPLTMIVPFAPGGSTDIIGRMVAERLSAVLKQPVVVENRAGAGGNIGAMAVAKAKPDGRTMLFGTTGILSINEFIYPNPGYKIGQDLIPVVYATSISNVLILNKNLPVASVADLIKLAKEKPGKLSFGSSGAGSSTHLSGELFKVMAGVDITHIPYKGSSQALIDLMGGQIDMIFDNAPSAVPLLESGQVKALAITSMEPLSVLPQVPTMDQAGVKGYESLSWTGIVVPGGTPPAVIERLNHEVNLILQEPQVLKKLDELGARPTGGSQQAFAAHIESERTKWGKIVREAHIQAQ
jgi:tripartite-type tricarboxylate transporter receptor subunit TctC